MLLQNQPIKLFINNPKAIDYFNKGKYRPILSRPIQRCLEAEKTNPDAVELTVEQYNFLDEMVLFAREEYTR